MKSSYFNREINFLPLLDVIFILLFFFMFSLVVASSMGQVEVRVPKIKGERLREKGEKLIVNLDVKGRIILEGEVYTEMDSFQRALKNKGHQEICLAADGRLNYSEILTIISVMKDADVEKVNLLFEGK